ncbi:MAG: hypothetical protein O9325_18940, partial [Roseomonas sp.]|nr:hypothetical protein [Roseomonas sp.]
PRRHPAAPAASHWPEREVTRVALTVRVEVPPFWPRAPRTVRLPRQPLEVGAMALLQDAPPSLLRMGRQAHRVRHLHDWSHLLDGLHALEDANWGQTPWDRTLANADEVRAPNAHDARDPSLLAARPSAAGGAAGCRRDVPPPAISAEAGQDRSEVTGAAERPSLAAWIAASGC